MPRRFLSASMRAPSTRSRTSARSAQRRARVTECVASSSGAADYQAGAPPMKFSLGIALLVFAAAPLAAQRITLGVDAALADYREQGPALRFTGGGLSGRAAVEMWRVQLHARATRMHVTGASESAEGTDAFDIAENDVALRVRVKPRIAIAAGILTRTMTPQHAAQSLQTWRA